MDGRSSRRDKHLLKTHHAFPVLSRLVENLKRNGFCNIKMNKARQLYRLIYYGAISVMSLPWQSSSTLYLSPLRSSQYSPNPVLMASVETNAVPKCVDSLRE